MKQIEPIHSAKLAVSPGPFSGNIVAVTVYLKNMQNFKRLNEIYKTYFKDYYPSRTCIAVLELPLKASVEMTITASTHK